MQKQFRLWTGPGSKFFSVIAGLSLSLMCHGANATTIIDHLSGFDGLSFPTNVNGIGQTFIARESFLQDASFLVTSSPDTRVWWSDAHIQVFHGLPPGSIGTTASNLLYTSPKIDFGSLAQTGSFIGSPLYELKFSKTGLNTLLPLVPGDTYTMTLSNFGTSGNAFYADNQPSFYPEGSDVIHVRNETSWRGPFSFEDLAFKLVMVPEPGCTGFLWLMLTCLAFLTKRHATISRRRGIALRSA